MYEPELYELQIKKVSVSPNDDGTGTISVTYKGHGAETTASEPYASDQFEDVFECCQNIARTITVNEFRRNDGVNFSFNMVDDNGISIWHTKPSNFLKVPLQMNMDWVCGHLQKNFKSCTTLGVIEMPDEVFLHKGGLSTQKLAEVLIDSMASGLELMGLMFLRRNKMGHEHAD